MTITGSLRDTVEAAYDSVITPETPPPVDAPPAPAPEPAPAPAAAEAPAKPKADETGRLHGQDGKYVPKAGDKPAAAPAPAAAPVTPKYQRPSTWRKETWGVWDKLNSGQALTPEEIHLMAEEAIKRDADFSNGVSTYKKEWENAKPLLDTMAEFRPLLQQHNIEPTAWIKNLGNAHRTLALGTPEQKVAMFARLAQDYGVPLGQMFVRGEDGQIYMNPQVNQMAAAPPPQPQVSQQDIDARVKQALAQQTTSAEIQAFAAQKEKYPHFETLRETMAATLDAGLVETLDEAYHYALKHPRHAELYNATQEQSRQAEEAKAVEERRRQAEAARRKAISPRTTTPTSPAAAADGKKGIRAAIETAFDEHVGGRV